MCDRALLSTVETATAASADTAPEELASAVASLVTEDDALTSTFPLLALSSDPLWIKTSAFESAETTAASTASSTGIPAALAETFESAVNDIFPFSVVILLASISTMASAPVTDSIPRISVPEAVAAIETFFPLMVAWET